MNEFKTTYPDNNYSVHVGHNIYNKVMEQYTSEYNEVFYIVDEVVYNHFKDEQLKGIKEPIITNSGESAKSSESFIHLTESLLEKGIKRSSLVVVIGGGATGDVGGFSAAVTLRGVDFIQVPTTILAHDSAIGGKTAINSSQGKNLIGAFHRPVGVVYDLEFLNTLPQSEILSGFGEVFKHALLNSEEAALELMHKTSSGIDIDVLEESIIDGIKTKMDYVSADEFESGSRKFLNLGHTLGHAIEYQYKIPHGQAIILGLYAMMFISNQTSEKEIFDLGKYYKYFSNLNYPVELLGEMDAEQMINLMKHDKKNIKNEAIGFVLVDETFSPYFTELNINALKSYLSGIKESI